MRKRVNFLFGGKPICACALLWKYTPNPASTTRARPFISHPNYLPEAHLLSRCHLCHAGGYAEKTSEKVESPISLYMIWRRPLIPVLNTAYSSSHCSMPALMVKRGDSSKLTTVTKQLWWSLDPPSQILSQLHVVFSRGQYSHQLSFLSSWTNCYGSYRKHPQGHLSAASTLVEQLMLMMFVQLHPQQWSRKNKVRLFRTSLQITWS